MGTRLRVASETSDLAEIKAELADEPVDGIARISSENTDEVVASKITSRTLGIFEKCL